MTAKTIPSFVIRYLLLIIMLFVVLGNPTDKYKFTRHNAGFLFADWLCGESGWEENKNLEVLYKRESLVSHTDRIVIEFIKPMTFMNESGRAVSKYINFYKIDPKSNMILVFDDLDLDLGHWKFQREKGPKVHNGVLSVEEKLGTKNFARIRIGVQNSETRRVENGEKIAGADYVLQEFTKEELEILYKQTFPRIRESLSLMLNA
jgi:PTH1 family peptidyl-tRNA hydrolase